MYINVQEAVKLIHINDQEAVIHVRISDHIDVDIAYCFLIYLIFIINKSVKDNCLNSDQKAGKPFHLH